VAHVRLVQVGVNDGKLLEAVIGLGDRHRKTLGLLPREAFRESAAAGTLLAAMAGRQLAGYALYGLPRQEIRLAHLCVAPEWNGHKVARRLVEEITRRHPGRRGIKLNCRRDYGLGGMWEKLGFVPLRDRPGRGSDHAVLTTWWKDHGLPDLFSSQADEALLIVAIDCGVMTRMHDAPESAAAKDAQALHAEWLSDLLLIVVTPRLLHDIDKIEDDGERQRALRAAHSYHRPSISDEVVRQHMEHLTGAAERRTAVLPDGAAADRIRYAAEAAAAGAHVLVSTDEILTSLAEEIWERCQLQVLPPVAVVSTVHNLRESQGYSPGLLGTSLEARVVTSWQDGLLTSFGIQQGTGVDSHLAARLRAAISRGDGRCVLIADADGQPLALYAWRMDERVLEVRVLRTVAHRLESTLARQLVFTLRRHCRDGGGHAVRVTDPGVSDQVGSALDSDGFMRRDEEWAALVIDVCADTADVVEAAQRAVQTIAVAPPAIPALASAYIAASVERTLWPAKLIDSPLPSFLVPIKPGPADLLFGLWESLIPRPDELGISREHVYYRAPTRHGETAPARLLWYASTDKSTAISAVVACSRLDEVVVNEADALYDRFRHLGVFDRAQVRNIANHHKGRAMALRFSDTQILSRAVPLTRLRHLAEAQGHKLSLRSIFRISPRLFRAVYEEGHARP
jgi:GNAT superfamily N-acetyltransferase